MARGDDAQRSQGRAREQGKLFDVEEPGDLGRSGRRDDGYAEWAPVGLDPPSGQPLRGVEPGAQRITT